MTRQPSVLRLALALLRSRLLLEQIGLALLLFLLYVVWLRVPDASVLDVIGSAVLALGILAVAGAGESSLMLGLAGVPRSPARLLRGGLLLLAGAGLWFGWSSILDHMHGNDYLRAGYLNSRFPHQLRNLFSFDHLVLWLGWMWTALAWVGAAVIGLFVFVFTASPRPLGTMLRALRCMTYWMAVVLCSGAVTALTGLLVEWTPGHGLRVEMFSLVLRLSLAALADAALVCFLLSVVAVCVRQAESAYAACAGTPEASQLRTADNP